ncbi:MAG: patatin-like phospholipase family protein [Parachlamydiales bacterium]
MESSWIKSIARPVFADKPTGDVVRFCLDKRNQQITALLVKSESSVGEDLEIIGTPTPSSKYLKVCQFTLEGRRLTLINSQSKTIQEPLRPESGHLQQLESLFLQDNKPRVASPNELESLLFDAVVGAIERKEWTRLKEASPYLGFLKSDLGQSLLAYCVERGMIEPVGGVIHNRIESLLDSGQCVEAFHTAARLGHLQLLAMLWEVTEVAATDAEGKTALHVAIEHGQALAVESLVKNGASTRTCFKGLCATHWAVAQGQIQVLDVLLRSDAKTTLKSLVPDYGNVLHIAIQFAQEPMLRHLLTTYIEQTEGLLQQSNGRGLSPLMQAAHLGDGKAILLLKEKGAPLEQLDPEDRTALHWAVLGGSREAIAALICLGANKDANDRQARRPIDLVRDRQDLHNQHLFNWLKNLAVQPPVEFDLSSFSVWLPENVVFQGGGPKGIVYLGAIEALEQGNMLSDFKRVAGTSAGSITATILAMGCDAQESRRRLEETSIASWMDHPHALSRLKQVSEGAAAVLEAKGLLGKLWAIVRHPISTGSTIWSARALGQMLVWQQGICSGETFRKWMEHLINEKTGIEHCTFGELDVLIKKGKPFKELHAYSIKVGNNPEIVHFHASDPKYRDLVISDGIRASMSIPGVFIPHTLYFKDAQGRRYPRPDLGSYMDGGMLINFPLGTFDQMGYVYGGLTEKEAALPVVNRRTLGFSLYSSTQPLLPDQQVDSVVELIASLCRVYFRAEGLLHQHHSTPREIKIDCGDVGLLDFDIKPEGQEKLIESGRMAIAQCLTSGASLSVGGFRISPKQKGLEPAEGNVEPPQSRPALLNGSLPDEIPIEKLGKTDPSAFVSTTPAKSDKTELTLGPKPTKEELSGSLDYQSMTLPVLQQKVEERDHEAELELGLRYLKGCRGFPRDSGKAWTFIKRAAEGGNAEGQYQMGLLENGSWSHNFLNYHKTGRAWFNKAHKQGHIKATHWLADNDCEHQEGSGMSQRYTVVDHQEQAYYYYCAAQQNDPKGKRLVATCIAKGMTHFASRYFEYKDGFKFATEAAAAGDLEALRLVGEYYEKGMGVPADATMAFQSYKSAAEQGCISAYSELARCYAKGIGTPVDMTSAKHWKGLAPSDICIIY